MFTKSVGIFDRALRGMLGTSLVLAVLFGWIGGTAGMVILALGITLIASAATGVCFVYNSLGISTQEQS